MDAIKTLEAINHDRRRFFGAAAMTIAAGWVAWILLLTGLPTRSSETVLLNLGFPYAGTLWVTIGCAIGGLIRVGHRRQAHAAD